MLLSTVPPATDAGQERRATRYAARHVLWKLSRVPRRRECGRLPCSADGVALKVTVDAQGGRHAGWAGVSTCGSVWSCPVCSAKIANVRQVELLAAITEWTRRGGRIGFGTVTMRHYREHAIKALWDGLSAARQAMVTGRAWQAEQIEHGRVMQRTIKRGKRAGQVVNDFRVPIVGVVEATHGVNGWHLHVHMVLFLGPDETAASFDLLGAQMFARWRDSLGRSGLPLPIFNVSGRGKDFQLVEGDAAAALADYFTKGIYEGAAPGFALDGAAAAKAQLRGVSLEATRADMKDGSRGNRTPFGVLRGLVLVATTGDLGGRTPEDVAADEELWHDWERGSADRRQMTWTPGLREWLGRCMPDEMTDEEAAAACDGVADEVVKVDGATHKLIIACRADGLLLTAFERGQVQGWEMMRIFAGGADRMATGDTFADVARSCRSRLRLLV